MPLGQTVRCKLSAKASACKNYSSIYIFITSRYLCSLRDMQGAGGGSPRILAFKVLSFIMKIYMIMSFHSLHVFRQVLNTRWQLQLHPCLLLPYQLLLSLSEARRLCIRALRCAFNLRRWEHARLLLYHPQPHPPGGALQSRAVTIGLRSSSCR